MLKGLVVLIFIVAIHVRWIGNLARDRGRNIVVWILSGLMAGAVGFRTGLYIAERAIDTDTDSVGLLGALAPVPLTLAGMLIVLGILYRLPTHVQVRREWKVSSAKGGDATLVLEREAIELRWETRTDTIPRPDLRSAVADGECVRVTWASGEALLMPMMPPHTRQGRIRQSELLAKLIAPRDPAG